MKFKVLIAAILFALSLPVAAEWEPPQKSHEARLSDLRLPQNEAGTIGFKPCRDCSYEVRRVTANTEWIINGQRMSLEDFKRNLRRISDREDTPATVVEQFEDKWVSHVKVFPKRNND